MEIKIRGTLEELDALTEKTVGTALSEMKVIYEPVDEHTQLYLDICERMIEAQTPKQYKAVNAEFKKHGFNDRVPYFLLHPNLPKVVTAVLVIVWIVLAITVQVMAHMLL